MSKHETITAEETRFPLESLYLSPLNPRQNVTDDEVAELAESIRTAGLIQNLAGLRDDKGGIGIVAGGRRLRALQLLAKTDHIAQHPDLANPRVQIAPDSLTAQAWAVAENAARRDLHPADEIRAYGKMEKAGATVAVIARAFAVSENHVYKRLALANLPTPIIDALAQNAIGLGSASAFTISEDEQRSLEVLDIAKARNLSEHQIKTLLKPDRINATDRRVRFIGLDAYTEAGGKVTNDLFSDVVSLENPDLVDAIFRDKLSEVAGAIQSEAGWKWAETIEESYIGYHTIEDAKMARLYPEAGDLSEARSERYDELAELANGDVLDDDGLDELNALQAIIDGDYSDEQKTHAGIIAYVDTQGVFQCAKGIVRNEDKVAAIEAGLLQGSSHSTGEPAAKPAISNALADDLARVATGARQNAALANPELLLALLAYQLTGKMGYRNAFGLRTSDVANWPTTSGDGYELDRRLTTPADRPDDPFGSDLAKGFRAFRARGNDHVMAELTRHLAALVSIGDDKLAALLDKEVETDIRAVWTPTATNFFGRVGGAYLNDLWRDLLDLSENDAAAKSFAKLKKSEKADRLEKLFSSKETQAVHGVTAEQAERIAKWLPEGMA
ncbi:ParB/RepB/Spo0J family partition protein [Notoacmeibacter ruber]|uniref:ParB/RepB/Spo0J family partition protein n=1 Tax=Notoacmeibacter ruber TaxID=2670375 RepID=A0A3L7J3S8_9HYPH|nr:ParB/RepB/Spo0J family partition protein [Notoacmeibacter ruber]RLQ84985.1 ParB/RepB/Spo0J family partition protein [Notoacmeibacter ruber]